MVHTYPKAKEAINLGISMDQLYLIFSNRKTFPRRRFDPYIKAVSNFLKEIGYKVSHESIRKWFLKAGEIISNNKIKKKRGFIAADETIVFNLLNQDSIEFLIPNVSSYVLILKISLANCTMFLYQYKL